ncbi:MAG: bicyclomycin resistance protein, partial [Rhizobiales bacterium]|nr:bicyclomycin resistance protein [Rhizobacter sp.]
MPLRAAAPRRSFIVRAGAAMLCCALAAGVAAQARAPAGAPQKVLRYAMRIAETGFDPAQVTDLYSNTLIANVFEAPYLIEFQARPVRVRPNTAVAMPEVSADFTTFTVRIKPGIFFADDPAFDGKKRELVAEDYVYAIKRHFDPRWKSGKLSGLQNNKMLGLDELRDAAIKGKKPFDYDTPAEGLKAIDRYTLRFKLAQPTPRFIDELTDPATVGAVAREVVERYGD